MNGVFRILEKRFELRDSLDSYEEFSYITPEIHKDEKGEYQIKKSGMTYKYEVEYPNSGEIGHKEEKVYINSAEKEKL